MRLRLAFRSIIMVTTTNKAGEIGVFQTRFTGLITVRRLIGITYFPGVPARGPKRGLFVEAIPHMPSSWAEAAD